MSETTSSHRRPPRRRVPRRRTASDDFSGFEPMEHNQWTFEGQIEQLGRFARSTNRTTGWRRWAGKGILLAPLVVILASGIVVAFVELARAVF